MPRKKKQEEMQETEAVEKPQKKRSMRNAFIRVFEQNNTQEGLKVFTYEQIKQLVKDWNKSKSFKYYMIKHENEQSEDPRDLKRHYHVVLDFKSPTPFEDIKSKFPFGDIENCKSVKNCVQYLVHMNDESKTQYQWNEVITNDNDIDRFQISSRTKQLSELDVAMIGIKNGTIREYNLTEHVSIECFSNNKTKLLNALEYFRRERMNDKDRELNVMIFTGDTGTYKTTYAKQFAKNQNKSICISSSSNDPMQDYKGEDILVLDDLRDDAFKFHDLLKILDNHTSSSVQSRYNNKAFIGDTIIITSSLPLDSWYMEEKVEDKQQLYRRIQTQMQFTKDNITVFTYDENQKKYIKTYTLPNVNKFKPKETKQFVLGILENMGVEMSQEVKQQILSVEMPDVELGSIDDDLPF